MSKPSQVHHAQDLFVYLERIFSLGGIWPTKSSYVRFTICIVYFSLYLIMAYADFLEVFGNLELMVMNLVESIVYTITFSMVWVIRCSKLLKRIIAMAKQEIAEHEFEDSEEERIYYGYNSISKIFFKVSTTGMLVTVSFLYFRPLLSFSTINEASGNATESFILPLRVRTFFGLTNMRSYVLMYVYLAPMMYMSVCHMTAICALVILIFHICGKLSILSHRIRNIEVNPKENVDNRIRRLVEMHLKILWMAKSLDDTFHIILLDELLGNSVVLAISMYCVLLNFDVSAMATCFTFTFFAFTALLMLYGYCLIGEQLTRQSINVQDAYYHCNWQGMSRNSRKSVLICMTRAQVLLYLTAGKFYVFSLNGFTDVVKTSLAYLSMLRTVL